MANSRQMGYTWTPPKGLCPAILGCWVYDTTPGGISGIWRHDFWSLDCSLTPFGKVRVGAGSSPWIKRPASVAHLYPAGTPYRQDLRNVSAPARSVWVVFTGGAAAGLDKLTRKKGYARFIDIDGKLEKLMRATARIGHERGENGFWSAQSYLYLTIETLLCSEHDNNGVYHIAAKRDAAKSSFVQKADAYIKAHFKESVGLADIAYAAMVSVSALSHRYAQQTGETPMGMLARTRLAYAKSMLLKGERMRNVALETGFCDEFHLSKTFKSYEGLSPRQWLKTLGR